MQFAMMRATDRDRVFVADLSSERAGLGRTKMVGFSRRAAAHDAGLAGHESSMLLVTQANGLAHDTAADGADFLRDFRENVDAVCAFDARLCRGSNGVSCAFPSASASSFALKRSSTSCASGVVSRFLSGSRRRSQVLDVVGALGPLT